MPIYVYKCSNGAYLEVYQKTGDIVYKFVRDIPSEQVLNDQDLAGVTFCDKDTVERMPTAPGGFQGLPTPKFYK